MAFPTGEAGLAKTVLKSFNPALLNYQRAFFFQMSLKQLVAKSQIEGAEPAFYVVLFARGQNRCCVSSCWVMLTQALSLSQSLLQRIWV